MLRNKYLNDNDENRKLYTKQRNCCFSLLRKTKKAYYENLDEKKFLKVNFFSKTVKLHYPKSLMPEKGKVWVKMIALKMIT